MNIQPIQIKNNINFTCRAGRIEKLRDFGKVIQETGYINKKKLDIYSAYSEDGELIHKLYYLSDHLGNWIKSKLKFFHNGKCYKVIRSKNDRIL